jgi:hypothetical protein
VYGIPGQLFFDDNLAWADESHEWDGDHRFLAPTEGFRNPGMSVIFLPGGKGFSPGVFSCAERWLGLVLVYQPEFAESSA